MSKETTLTPMMLQYRNAKKEIPSDALLLFRMGDFYELFFEDAVKGSQIMDIALTKRAGVPMAGIPHHAMQSYLSRLLNAGVKVAIAEQMEDPKLAKGIVKREVTQIITPGTICDGDISASGKSNFLVGIIESKKGDYGVASLDISTGNFRITQVNTFELLEAELGRLQPAECLLSESLYKVWQDDVFPDVSTKINWTMSEDWIFDYALAGDELHRHFGVTSLDGFGCREYPIAVRAAGAVFHYVQNVLRRKTDHITVLSPYSSQSYMIVDRISQRNLELVEPLFSDSKNSALIRILDQSITPMGGRLLTEWILRPLLNKHDIDARLDAVSVYAEDQLLLLELREALKGIRDIERTISRLNVGSANARDLLVIQRALTMIPGIKAIVSLNKDVEILGGVFEKMHEFPELATLIEKAIVEEPPITIKDGGMIHDGYHDHLDEFRRGAKDGKSWIAKLQQDEQEKTGIKSIKVRFNKVFGYYIEVSNRNSDLVPENYVRKQTLVNAERFITSELKDVENKILGAEDKAKALEYEIFQNIRSEVISQTALFQTMANAIAVLDAVAALAHVALENNYKRPKISSDIIIDIKGGRHPVVDHLMTDELFVPNDSYLNNFDNQILIITGPNMAGKSTYIRQVALLVLMAQMGSYIPVESATIGVVDRIFTRIGAADDLSKGQSTFMVEMLETANILNNATPNSLVILDEVGRGTSTFDGLSIAWAIAEFIHNNQNLKARTLFATHYHELTELSMTFPGIKNYNVAVIESGDTIKFIRKILPGAADKSYGIHVARLAGLPKTVLERADEVLDNLQGNAIDEESHQPKLAKRKKKRTNDNQQPNLFEL